MKAINEPMEKREEVEIEKKGMELSTEKNSLSINACRISKIISKESTHDN